MHVRCPHCHNRIELLDDAELSDISCPSCGSNFSLVAEDTLTYDAAGQTVGHFELIEQLGVGAFGTVWKAKDTELDRIVAVKIPRKGQLNAEEVEKFFREARAAAQLRHPNIVSVHEVGREDTQAYIVSDIVQGVTLSDWIEGQGLSSREAAELCAKLADALQHAHEAGVIHRDLKPSNIMMDLEGEPHIMDFGLAKRDVGEITMTVEGRIIGTPAYMSPEQARGEGHHADRRSDVYSLGVILFLLLTTELPFRGNPRMLVVQILKDDPPSPRKLNSGIPRDLETICLKCLEKDPQKRYASTQELAEDLRRFLRSEPIHARRITAVGRSWRWCKRNQLAVGLAFVFVVALIFSLSLALRSTYRVSEQLLIQLTLDKLVAGTHPAVNGIHRILSEAQGDVVRVARSPTISEIIRTVDNEGKDQQQHRSTSEVRIDSLAVILKTLLETHRERRSYSVVDDKGQEILHVNREGRTPDDERKNEGKSAFYLATSKLAKAQVYVSPMQLDRNGNAVLYVATPLFDSRNTCRGMLLSVLDGRRVLTSAVRGTRYDIVDESGMYLYCQADPSKAFGKARYSRDMAFAGADMGGGSGVMSSGSSAGSEVAHKVAHIPG